MEAATLQKGSAPSGRFLIGIAGLTVVMMLTLILPGLCAAQEPQVSPTQRASYGFSTTVRIGQPGPPLSGREVWTGIVQNYQKIGQQGPEAYPMNPGWAER